MAEVRDADDEIPQPEAAASETEMSPEEQKEYEKACE